MNKSGVKCEQDWSEKDGEWASGPFFISFTVLVCLTNRLVGLVVKVSASRAEDPRFESRLHRDFLGPYTSDFKIGTPVATLPGAWCWRVSAGTSWPGVSILWLGEMESLVCNFCLSVAACKIVQIRPWDTLSCCWDVKQPTNKQTVSPPCWPCGKTST